MSWFLRLGELRYPVILEMPAPVLKGYSRESAVAEKAESMVRFGPVNSRMKDFYDIWLLSKTFSFEGAVLSEAIHQTFNARSASLPEDMKSRVFVAGAVLVAVAVLVGALVLVIYRKPGAPNLTRYEIDADTQGVIE